MHFFLQFPELCHFQKANYSFSLSPADTNSQPVASSDTRTFVGGGDRDIRGQLHNLKLDLKNFYKGRVNAELLGNGGRIAGPAFDCSISGMRCLCEESFTQCSYEFFSHRLQATTCSILRIL